MQTYVGNGFNIAQLKVEANQIVKRYRALDAATQEELKNAFPMVTKVVYSQFCKIPCFLE
jgi:hypothetical protein